MDVIALDKVQKGRPISGDEFRGAQRARRLVEGRRPNFFVSADVAATTDTMVDYLNETGHRQSLLSNDGGGVFEEAISGQSAEISTITIRQTF